MLNFTFWFDWQWFREVKGVVVGWLRRFIDRWNRRKISYWTCKVKKLKLIKKLYIVFVFADF